MTIALPQRIMPVPERVPASLAPPPHRLAMNFTGSGEAYFRIWIVNLLLTLVTLGVYSAWAKVRREKFFHQHSVLAGTGFDYHGTPAAILRGRLISLGLLALTQIDYFGTAPTIAAWLVLFGMLPWLMQRSLRFRMTNTSYRGLRFSFDGSVAQAYAVFGGVIAMAALLILVPALALAGLAGQLIVLMIPVVIVLLYPVLHAKWRRYALTGACFGNLHVACTFRQREFLAIYVSTIALWFLMALPAVVLVAAIDQLDLALAHYGIESHAFGKIATFVGGLIVYALASSAWPYISARVQNLTWNQTTIGEHAIQSSLEPIAFVKLQLRNLLLTLVTLGLYRPFAAVATARMRVAALSLAPTLDFNQILARVEPADRIAVGSEALDLLGFDISL